MSTSRGKKDDSKDPFGGMNVVEALLGGARRSAVSPQTRTDADVMLEAEQKRAKLRKMKPWQRKKYERDARRIRFTVSISLPLSELVNEISEQEQVSASSAAAWLLAVGLDRWKKGEVSSPITTRPRGLRTEASLVIPAEWDGERKERSFDVPLSLKEEVYKIVNEYKCGRSDAASWLMSVGATAYRAGAVEPTRVPGDSIRYPFKLVLPLFDDEAHGQVDKSPKTILKQYYGNK